MSEFKNFQEKTIRLNQTRPFLLLQKLMFEQVYYEFKNFQKRSSDLFKPDDFVKLQKLRKIFKKKRSDLIKQDLFYCYKS